MASDSRIQCDLEWWGDQSPRNWSRRSISAKIFLYYPFGKVGWNCHPSSPWIPESESTKLVVSCWDKEVTSTSKPFLAASWVEGGLCSVSWLGGLGLLIWCDRHRHQKATKWKNGQKCHPWFCFCTNFLWCPLLYQTRSTLAEEVSHFFNQAWFLTVIHHTYQHR